MAADLIAKLERNLCSLIIGKAFTAVDLAYYDQGEKYPSLLTTNVVYSINKVMLSVYSKKQDDLEQLKQMLRRSIRIGIFILAPILVGFSSVAGRFISLVLTEKWTPCIPFIRIFCIAYLTRPLETTCHQALLAIGRSDVALKILSCINAVAVATLMIAVFIFHSVLLVAAGSLLATCTSLAGFMFSAKKYLGYTVHEQVADISPTIVCVLIMGAAVTFVGNMNASEFAALIIQILTGVIVYILAAALLKVEPFLYLTTTLFRFKEAEKET